MKAKYAVKSLITQCQGEKTVCYIVA